MIWESICRSLGLTPVPPWMRLCSLGVPFNSHIKLLPRFSESSGITGRATMSKDAMRFAFEVRTALFCMLTGLLKWYPGFDWSMISIALRIASSHRCGSFFWRRSSHVMIYL